ncbi:MAG: hypothetical protein COA47_00915 [Robiginitomaculum sp.]|nr:MAG: hypothetical protein COA47_00915 [Robiginitomaculum sp.]
MKPLGIKTALVLAGLLSLLITACLPAIEAAPDITLSKAWVRLPAGGRDITGGYLVINNRGGADVLLSASSSIAEEIEMHEHIMEDDMMKMREISALDVPKKQQLVFAPGGYHLMMFGVDGLFLGQEVELTLEFERSGRLSTTAIVGKQLTPAH